MRSILFAALLVVSFGCVSAPTAAQSAGNVPVETPGPQPTAHDSDTNATRIDGNTEIVGSEYRPDEGIARITLRSNATQVVSISDAGRFQGGGKIPVRSVALESGETTTVEVPVTEQDGYVGVAISTENTPLYAEIVQRPSGGGLDILRALSSLQAWLAGAGVAFVWMVIAGWNVMRGENGRPEVA
ncbi:hypothetical protein AMS69_05665 [Haloarcula rubripromontorii]|uniref:Uncharacterized protein n=1 Tax=Haloarcula rubripromontorii TaxID=1705562 RepID=A0A0M9AJR1_9EURY|nr:hypothetical protein [Haloarcula rubripromontorii]KOX93412.1 hypothetical protein AMS69_05665 [Haloarcula rubripromontorii]